MASALINRKGTTEVYVGAKDAEKVTLADKLVNLSTVGEVGNTVEEVEMSWLDTDKEKYPGDVSPDAIDIEQNLLIVEDEKLNEYAKTGTIFPFALFVNKDDDTVLLGRIGKGYLTSYKVSGGTKGETMLAKYTIQPVAILTTTKEKPTATPAT